jgi:hypothetical protein
MAKKPETKALEERLFATAYLDNGMNATQAIQSLKPHLTHESAKVAGSELLTRANASGAIDSILGGVKTHWQEVTDIALALSRKWLDSNDEKLQLQALKFLGEIGKVIASATSGPKTAIQHNKYTLPKA